MEAFFPFLFDMEENRIKMVELMDVVMREDDDIVARARLVRCEQ